MTVITAFLTKCSAMAARHVFVYARHAPSLTVACRASCHCNVACSAGDVVLFTWNTLLLDSLGWSVVVLCRFWCQVIFDSSLQRCIDSYLSEARRPHDLSDSTRDVPSDVKSRVMLVHRLVFLVCLRSSTHHESTTNFIDGKVFGDILYENYIFDIPRLMDICVVYGHGSDAVLVSKMIGNVFLQQPKYNDDLRAVVASIEKVTSQFMFPCFCSVRLLICCRRFLGLLLY